MRAIKDSFDGFQQWQTKVYKEKLSFEKPQIFLGFSKSCV